MEIEEHCFFFPFLSLLFVSSPFSDDNTISIHIWDQAKVMKVCDPAHECCPHSLWCIWHPNWCKPAGRSWRSWLSLSQTPSWWSNAGRPVGSHDKQWSDWWCDTHHLQLQNVIYIHTLNFLNSYCIYYIPLYIWTPGKELNHPLSLGWCGNQLAKDLFVKLGWARTYKHFWNTSFGLWKHYIHHFISAWTFHKSQLFGCENPTDAMGIEPWQLWALKQCRDWAPHWTRVPGTWQGPGPTELGQERWRKSGEWWYECMYDYTNNYMYIYCIYIYMYHIIYIWGYIYAIYMYAYIYICLTTTTHTHTCIHIYIYMYI